MRHLLLFAGFYLFTNMVGAQTWPSSDKQVFVYTNTGFALGSPCGGRISLGALFVKHHELSIGYNYFSKKARSTPGDYLAGQGWNLGFAPDYPQDEWSGMAVTYGYVLYPKRRTKQRYVLRSGLLIGSLRTPDAYTPTSGGISLFGGSGTTPGYYSYTSNSHERVAFIMQPSMDYTPTQAFGLSVGLFCILSDGMNGGGISTSMLLGKVSNIRKAEPARLNEMRRRRNFRRAKKWAM